MPSIGFSFDGYSVWEDVKQFDEYSVWEDVKQFDEYSVREDVKQWFHLQPILVWTTSQLVIDYLVWLIGWMEVMTFNGT